LAVPIPRADAEEVGARTAVSAELLEEFHRSMFLPLVRRATWRNGLSKEDARDVVQEAFLLAVVKLDPSRNPKAWLIGVVDRLCLNLQRTEHRRANLAEKWGFGATPHRLVEDEDLGGYGDGN